MPEYHTLYIISSDGTALFSRAFDTDDIVIDSSLVSAFLMAFQRNLKSEINDENEDESLNRMEMKGHTLIVQQHSKFMVIFAVKGKVGSIQFWRLKRKLEEVKKAFIKYLGDNGIFLDEWNHDNAIFDSFDDIVLKLLDVKMIHKIE